MRALSIRQKTAAIERSSVGPGVSVSARKYWRNYYTHYNLPQMLGDNQFINDTIAGDFQQAQPIHRFILRSKEIAEIRKSSAFYYIAVIRNSGQYDIIVIQPAYKESDPEISKRRLSPEWLSQQRG